MNDSLLSLLALLAAYLIGSLTFAVIFSKLMRLPDPRSYGSGNPGATNVLRSGSKVAAILTLLCDVLKGYLPVLAVLIWGERHGLGEGTAALVGVGAFLGHLWPVYFKFKGGGKGVATAAGVLFALNPLLGVATLATFAILVFFTRFVSLGSIVAALFAPLYQALIWGMGPIVGAAGLMGLLLVWRHEANIKRLFAGKESRLGAKK